MRQTHSFLCFSQTTLPYYRYISPPHTVISHSIKQMLFSVNKGFARCAYFSRSRRGLRQMNWCMPYSEYSSSLQLSINHLLMRFRMFKCSGRWGGGGGCFYGNPQALSQSWSGSLHASSEVFTSISLWVRLIWEGPRPHVSLVLSDRQCL